MKNWKKIVPVIAIGLFVCSVVGYNVTAKAQEEDKIADKVTIGGIDVGGMNALEASEAVETHVEEAMNTTFTLQADENQIEVKAKDLGITWSNTNVVDEALHLGKTGNLIRRYKDKKDLENSGKELALKYEVDEAAVSSILEENAATLNTSVVNNGLTREDGKFVFVKGQSGVEVNVENSIAQIETFLSSDWDGEDATIDLVADVVEPEGSEEELSKVKDVLGTFNTSFATSSAARCANIENAVSKINGTVLYPGEEFSASGTMGERTAENGYQLAGAYENGQTVEAYGGGVCQVSTTLYNAVMLAELNVTERSNHSMIVKYVDPSRDAAIAGDYKDLKFKNNTNAPIYIEGYTAGKVLYFTIYGQETRDANRKVTYESEIVSQEDPAVQFVTTADPLGTISEAQSAHTGYHAKLWKIVTIDGVEESREQVNTSVYKPSAKIINIGLGTDNADAINAVNAAIATGDEATVRATVAQYAAQTTETAAPAPSTEEQAIVQEPSTVVPTDGQQNENNSQSGDDQSTENNKTDDNAQGNEDNENTDTSSKNQQDDNDSQEQ